MQKALQGRLQAWLVTGSRTRQTIAIVVLCLIVGLVGGALFAFVGPILASAFLAAAAGGLLMLRSTQFTFFTLVTLICLLPFGSLPLPDIGFTPTLLDLVLVTLLFSWLFQVARKKTGQPIGSPLGVPIVIFMVLACVSFVVGLSFASITTNLLRQFAEFLLNMFLFFLVLNNVHSREQLEQIVTVLILAGFAAALVGLLLYFLPQHWTIRLLSTLRIFRYPAGSAVLRFVEDNPDLPLRATSTSIDPNVLGGLLGIVTGVAAPQLVARRPLPLLGRWLRRRAVNWLVLPILGALATCLLLTYSRSALAGLTAALFVLALLRYPKLLLLVLIAALLILLLPQTQWYVQHFVEMIHGQDLATQMRFGEYKDSIILISRYPLLGVGFAGAPDIDTYIGVSSVYLLIAEEMGLIGLAVFLFINVLAIRHILHWLTRDPNDQRLEAIILGLLTALLAALISGIGDHYFFNISFQHAVALYWLCLGLAIRATLLPSSRRENSAAAEA
jgi:O-antigen ligase